MGPAVVLSSTPFFFAHPQQGIEGQEEESVACLSSGVEVSRGTDPPTPRGGTVLSGAEPPTPSQRGSNAQQNHCSRKKTEKQPLECEAFDWMRHNLLNDTAVPVNAFVKLSRTFSDTQLWAFGGKSLSCSSRRPQAKGLSLCFLLCVSSQIYIHIHPSL